MPKLHGKVMLHGDTPASTAVVELHNTQGDTLDQVQVDDRGAYIYHLVPGQWRLNVWDAHGHRGSAQVELSDDDQQVDVHLEEPAGGH